MGFCRDCKNAGFHDQQIEIGSAFDGERTFRFDTIVTCRHKGYIKIEGEAGCEACTGFEPKESTCAGWISVNDKLPEPWETVMVYVKLIGHKKTYYELSYYSGTKFDIEYHLYWPNGAWKGKRCKVTHWMPLPDPPEIREG